MNVKVCQYLLPYTKSVKKMNQDLNVRSTILKLNFWKKKFLTYQWVEALEKTPTAQEIMPRFINK